VSVKGLLATYLLGGTSDKSEEMYRKETVEVELRRESKMTRAMSDGDVDGLLGRLEYENDFVTYFEGQRSAFNDDMWSGLQHWLLDRANPFLPGLVGGYAHPLIMLADSVELGSPTLAFDALALAAVDWNPLKELIVANIPPSQDSLASLAAILDEIRHDQAFDGVVPQPGIEHLADILGNRDANRAVIRYLSLGCSYLSRSNSDSNVTEEMVELAIRLLTCTHVPGTPAFDFYLNHNLTFVNCLRILLPVFRSEEAKKTLLRSYWLLTILAFVTQGRPLITPEIVQQGSVSEPDMTWDDVKRSALAAGGGIEAKQPSDTHFLKAVQIMVAVGKEMKGIEPLLIAAASKLVKEFDGWTGFGQGGVQLNTP